MVKRDGRSDPRRAAGGGPDRPRREAVPRGAAGNRGSGPSPPPGDVGDDSPAAKPERVARAGRRPLPEKAPGPAPAGHGQDRVSRQARQFGDRPRWDPPARSVGVADGARPSARRQPTVAREGTQADPPKSAQSGRGQSTGRDSERGQSTSRDRAAPPDVHDVAAQEARPAATAPRAQGVGRPVPSTARRPLQAAPPPARPESTGSARRELIEKRTYDPRREERRKAARVALPDEIEARMLDADARRELRPLSTQTADLVARHLVATGQLLDDDPAQALAHAHAAKAMAGRIGVVREAVGLAAYAAQHWAEALSELRAARRITGRPEHLAVLADCERALGRPERALSLADDPDVPGLPQGDRVELVMVLAGARADLGQRDAAVLTLQDPATRTTAARPWAVRLWYAYADALLHAGREAEAREWFGKASAADGDGQTDAGDRLLLLDGVVLNDFDEQDDQDNEPDSELADYIARTYTARPSEA